MQRAGQPAATSEDQAAPRQVALFVTCLADLMRPSAARAALRLLEDAGCEVSVPEAQTCCGQPQYNSGDYQSARTLARKAIVEFENHDYVVAPSGSCAGMLVHHYPKLLDDEWRERAQRLADRVYELTTFLLEVCDYTPPVQTSRAVAYHDSCAGLRELSVREQPRELLSRAGIEVLELSQRDVCCGFGGTFCAKMPTISAKMADDKLADVENTGADTLLAGDLGCLLALAGRARRQGQTLQFQHIAEMLVNDAQIPTIAMPAGTVAAPTGGESDP